MDLFPEEVSDLFLCAHKLAPVIQREYRGTSLTIAVQVGGREAGRGWGGGKDHAGNNDNMVYVAT